MEEQARRWQLSSENNSVIFNTTTIFVAAYMAAIGAAEALRVFAGAIPSAICHALLVVLLLNQYVMRDQTPYRRILPVLALVPLLSILGLALPLKQVPQIYWYAMIGVPFLVAIALTARLLGLSTARLGLRPRSWLLQLLIACSGLPLSMAAFRLSPLKPLITTLGWRDVVIGVVILIVFTAFAEEMLFRGLLQQVAGELFGSSGVLWSSCFFAIAYIGSRSPSYILFIGLVGLFFSWCVRRTGSIWGVILAHGLINVGMVFVWPFVDARLSQPAIVRITATTQLVLWLLVALGLGLGALVVLQWVNRQAGALHVGHGRARQGARLLAETTPEGGSATPPSGSHGQASPDPGEPRRKPDPAEGRDQTRSPEIERTIAELNQRIEDAERKRAALVARIHALERQQGTPARTESAAPVSREWRQWRFSVSQLLIAIALGLAILGLIDYLIKGDSIPLLLESEAVPAGSAPAGVVQPTGGAAIPTAAILTNRPAGGTGLLDTATPLSSPLPTPAAPGSGPVAQESISAESAPAPIEPTAPVSAPTVARSLPTSGSPAATEMPGPTAGPPTAAEVLRQVAAAEAALRTGQLEGTIDYGNGTRSSAQVRFDLGADGGVPRLHIVTTYQSASGTQTVERITIGDKAWQRQPGGEWTTIAEQEGAWGQVQTFLPHAASITSAETDSSTGPALLHWYDAVHDADMTLQVDLATGVPRELRQVTRGTGLALTVIYSGWNTPVEINPPAGT